MSRPIISKQQCKEAERIIIASILEEIDGRYRKQPWGKWVCLALAHWQDWNCDWSKRVAKAVGESVANPTRANIVARLGHEWAKLLSQPMFRYGLPMPLADMEAELMVWRYQAKKLQVIVGIAYCDAREHPEHAHCIATTLREQLQEFETNERYYT